MADNESNMKSLVTGATGFVGANLIEALNARGWPARALMRKTSSLRALDGLNYEQAPGDILDPASLAEAMRGIACVFHVAAAVDYWRVGIDALYRINIEGTSNVLRAALRAGVRRVVFTSSVAALGAPDWMTPADESHAFNLRPEQYHYGYSKVLAEQVVQQYVRKGLDAVIVNPAVIMGPRDVNVGSGSILTEFRKHAIAVYPPGGVSVIDVGDVAFGHIAAAERGRTGARYILSGQNLWHKDVLGIAAEVVGRPRPWLRLPRFTRYFEKAVDFARRQLKMALPISGDQIRISTETWWYDNTKARTELGLNPRPWREACERAWAWYQQHGIV